MDDIFERFINVLIKEKTKKVLSFVLYFTFVITLIGLDLPIIVKFIITLIQLSTITIFSSAYLTLWLNKMNDKIESLSKVVWIEFKKILKEIILFFIIITIISGYLLSFFISGNSENQIRVINEFYQSPILSFITAVILAPIAEEFIFRYLPYQFISNKKLYVIIASIIFASLHVINDANAFYYIWPYMIRSFYYSWRYYKTKDILVTISIHSFNNFLSILVISKLF